MANPKKTAAPDVAGDPAVIAPDTAQENPPKAAAKPRAPAKQRAVEPLAIAESVVVASDAREPRYEAVAQGGKHTIIADPESHVRYCSKCDTPEHMTDGSDCTPRAG